MRALSPSVMIPLHRVASPLTICLLPYDVMGKAVIPGRYEVLIDPPPVGGLLA